MTTAPIPGEIILANQKDPMAVINFLKRKRTVAVPARPNERGDFGFRTSAGNPLPPQRRGYGYDCLCFGTGWKNGQFRCGQHVPLLPLRYIL